MKNVLIHFCLNLDSIEQHCLGDHYRIDLLYKYVDHSPNIRVMTPPDKWARHGKNGKGGAKLFIVIVLCQEGITKGQWGNTARLVKQEETENIKEYEIPTRNWKRECSHGFRTENTL